MEYNIVNIINKKTLIIVNLFIILNIFSFVFGVQQTSNNEVENHYGTFDLDISEDVIKTSSKKNSYLPYIYFSTQRILADRPDNRTGLLVSNSSIEISAKHTGLLGIFSNDSIRINETVEYPIIFSNSNVIIDKDIGRSAIIVSNAKVIIKESANITNDLICISNILQVDGTVRGSVLAICKDVSINGKIEHDLRVHANNVTLKNENCVNNNIYIKTENKDLKLPLNINNAIVNIIKEDKYNFNIFNVLLKIIINSLIFVLVYVFLGKKIISKYNFKELFELNKKTLYAILCGIGILLSIPFVLLILILISTLGIHQITVPIIVAYIAVLIIGGMLSTFIVGLALFDYIKSKYLNELDLKYDKTTLFFIYFSLGILANLPVIGYYITIILLILSYGIIIYSFKKQK